MTVVTDNPHDSVEPLDPRAVLEAALPAGMKWNQRELVQLGVIERLARHIGRLEEELKTHGYIDRGSMGQVRVSPIVTELRLQYAALARAAEGIRLPTEVQNKSIRHQNAANARHQRTANQRGRRDA
jgi:hypothetical protein